MPTLFYTRLRYTRTHTRARLVVEVATALRVTRGYTRTLYAVTFSSRFGYHLVRGCLPFGLPTPAHAVYLLAAAALPATVWTHGWFTQLRFTRFTVPAFDWFPHTTTHVTYAARTLPRLPADIRTRGCGLRLPLHRRTCLPRAHTSRCGYSTRGTMRLQLPLHPCRLDAFYLTCRLRVRIWLPHTRLRFGYTCLVRLVALPRLRLLALAHTGYGSPPVPVTAFCHAGHPVGHCGYRFTVTTYRFTGWLPLRHAHLYL